MDHGNHHMNWEEKQVLIEVTKVLLKERCVPGNHTYRKCIAHASEGNLGWLRTNLKKAGIDPKRLDAILPLIRS